MWKGCLLLAFTLTLLETLLMLIGVTIALSLIISALWLFPVPNFSFMTTKAPLFITFTFDLEVEWVSVEIPSDSRYPRSFLESVAGWLKPHSQSRSQSYSQSCSQIKMPVREAIRKGAEQHEGHTSFSCAGNLAPRGGGDANA